MNERIEAATHTGYNLAGLELAAAIRKYRPVVKNVQPEPTESTVLPKTRLAVLTEEELMAKFGQPKNSIVLPLD